MIFLPCIALTLAILMTVKMMYLSRHPEFPVMTQAAGRLLLRWSWRRFIQWDVVVLDLDRLKQVNQATGDQSLTDILFAEGMSLRHFHIRRFRLPDLTVMMQFDNGDKFVVLCRTGTGQGLAERLCRQMMNVDIPDALQERLDALTGQRHISATFVVVPGVRDVLGAIREADMALFHLKDSGHRNAVFMLWDTKK